MYKLYIVEDDKALASELQRALNKWGFECIIAENFEGITEEFAHISPHGVLMDVNIPAFDGFYWCKEIRALSKVPIIFISSRDSSMDAIMAMNNGGDDYIQKPFEMSLLVAKLQAMMRRTYEYGVEDYTLLECKGLILNLNNTSVAYKQNEIELTKNEFKILQLLIEKQGKIVSRQSLMKRLWDDEVYVNENTLTVNVNRLRQKLEDVGCSDFITTKKGMGYGIL